MFQRISVLLILLAAIMLVASPALAQDRVTKLVVRNNLKNGRQFEAVFQPGKYVLHSRAKGFNPARFKLRVVSNPSGACFVRGGLNGRHSTSEADRLTLDASGSWRYFELRDTCFLRFEIRNYDRGAVNIRKVKKVKTVELSAEWREITFNPGYWSGSGKTGFSTAEVEVVNDNDPACKIKLDGNGIETPGMLYSSTTYTSTGHAFVLEETCRIRMRGVQAQYDENNELVHVPEPKTLTFVKSQ